MNEQELTHRRLHEEGFPHICKDYPPITEPLIKPFVFIGQVKDLSRLLEFVAHIKANAQKALELIHEIDGGRQCPYSPEARCTKTENKTCPEIDCQVWLDKVLGRETDQHIADNLKDY